MRDVMQNAGLEVFAEVGILIFFATFVVVALRTLFRRHATYDDVSNLPLDDGAEVNP